MDIETGLCPRDGQVRVVRKTFNTAGHLLGAIVTCGIWIPFWLLLAFWPRAWRCTVCGARVRVVGQYRIDMLHYRARMARGYADARAELVAPPIQHEPVDPALANRVVGGAVPPPVLGPSWPPPYPPPRRRR